MNTKTLKSVKPTKSAAPRRSAKKASDYNLHAAIIAVCVIAGLAVAACSASLGKPPERTKQLGQTPEVTPVVAASAAPTMEEATSGANGVGANGKVQGVTTTTFDQNMNAIDTAMYAPETVNGNENAVVAP